MEVLVTTNLQYFFFFSKIPLKVYSKPLELDMKSNDAADSKLQKNSMQRAW